MHLRLKECGTKYVHLGIIFGLGKGRDFGGSKGDFLMVFGEGIYVHAAIMHDSPIKEQWTPQKNMTNLHGDDVTPNLILVCLANTQRQETSLRNLQTFTLIKPLNGVWLRRGHHQLELIY